MEGEHTPDRSLSAEQRPYTPRATSVTPGQSPLPGQTRVVRPIFSPSESLEKFVGSKSYKTIHVFSKIKD